MPKVVREDIDSLNAVVKVTIEKDDYQPKFKEELKNIRHKASFKGFRKGKTPDSFIKKMYGKGLLGDIVTKMLQEELSSFMSDEKVNYVGQPLPTQGHATINFDVEDMEDYEFSFDIGIVPDFEIKGIEGFAEYDYYKVEVPEEKVEERLNYLRKRRGERIDAEDNVQEEDLITFDASELDGDNLKEDGWKTTFSILVERIADEAVKNELLGKKKGDKVRFNIYQLEKNAQPDYVKKYLLNFTQADIDEGAETGEAYEATIENVGRLQPAELNQEFFDQVFGEGEINSEEEARERIRNNQSNQFAGDADSLLYRDLRKKLLELNSPDMPLPDDFIKRWLKETRENEADSILNNYDDYANDMRWSLIKNKLFREYDFKLEQAEIEDMAKARVAGYFGGYANPELINNFLERIMQDQDQVNSLASEVLSNKLFYKLKDTVKLNEVKVSAEELEEKMKAMEAEIEAARAKTAPAIAAEEEE
jgi:trigger factor